VVGVFSTMCVNLISLKGYLKSRRDGILVENKYQENQNPVGMKYASYANDPFDIAFLRNCCKWGAFRSTNMPSLWDFMGKFNSLKLTRMVFFPPTTKQANDKWFVKRTPTIGKSSLRDDMVVVDLR
jgi:hypothetical protein